MALAPILRACEIMSWKDSSRADSHRSENIPALPPKRVRNPPAMLMGRDRVRTVIPRTTPKVLRTRNPASSNVVAVCMAPMIAELSYGAKNGIYSTNYCGDMDTMNETISMDASGRLVLPKAIRRRLNLSNGAALRVDVVAGRIELTPVENAGAIQTARKA